MLPHKLEFDAIGTKWSVETELPLKAREISELQGVIDDFDATYSRFRHDSLVSRVRHEGRGTYVFPDTIKPLLDTYQLLYDTSSHAINPLVGESLEDLGYDASYSLRLVEPRPAPAFNDVLAWDTRVVTFNRPALLDIGAIGKGYLVDMIAEMLDTTHSSFVVDGSGDIYVHTAVPQKIGLEHPNDETKIVGTVSLTHGSLCASATNRRAWGDGLHHILDARTGLPADTDIIATWAVAPTTMIADALASGLFFSRPVDLRKAFGSFSYVILKRDNTVQSNITDKQGELFI